MLRSLPCPLPLPPRCPPLRRLLAPNLVRPLGSTAPGIHLPSVSHWHASAVARSGGSSLRRCSHFRTRIHVFSTHAHPTLQASPTAAALSDPAASVSPPSAPHARSRFCPAVSCPSTVPFFAQMVQNRTVEWSREMKRATRQPAVACLAAAATGVLITPYVAAYGMRAGLSFMHNNGASEPMIVQMLITELAKKLPERSFFPCHSRGRRRARTTHAGTRSHCTVLHSCPPAHTHADARSRSHAHTRTDT